VSQRIEDEPIIREALQERCTCDGTWAADQHCRVHFDKPDARELARQLVANFHAASSPDEAERDYPAIFNEDVEQAIPLLESYGLSQRQAGEQADLERAAQHWPVGELGDELPDFRCGCGALLVGRTQDERVAAWKEHILTLLSDPKVKHQHGGNTASACPTCATAGSFTGEIHQLKQGPPPLTPYGEAWLERERALARLDFIEMVCADICPFCADQAAGFPELHEGKYHTKVGVDPGWENHKCYAADLRERMLRLAELERAAKQDEEGK